MDCDENWLGISGFSSIFFVLYNAGMDIFSSVFLYAELTYAVAVGGDFKYCYIPTFYDISIISQCAYIYDQHLVLLQCTYTEHVRAESGQPASQHRVHR